MKRNYFDLSGGIENVRGIFAEYQEYRSNAEQKASAASERLIHTAYVLPNGGFLGLQIDPAICSNHIFSSPQTCVTADDCIWIFKDCATVSDADPALEDVFCAKGRAVYILSPGDTANGDTEKKTSDKLSFHRSGNGTDHPCNVFLRMLEMLSEAGGLMRIYIASGSDVADGRGSILFSLPHEMTLRFRSMLSITFPYAGVIRLCDPADGDDGRTSRFSDQKTYESLCGVLSALLYRQPQLKSDDFDEDFLVPDDCYDLIDDPAVFSEKEPEEKSRRDCFTPIEELNLGIRGYQCLKRAGIDSIEKLCRVSDAELKELRNLGRRSFEDIKEKVAQYKSRQKSMSDSGKTYTEMLAELVGLKEMKDQIKKLTAFAKLKKELCAKGGDTSAIAFNMEFVGNPGTAKTTAARIVAGILYEIGLLHSSETVEVGRADLVAKYVGQTAVRVKEVFEKARGKVLFIDEAYSLIDSMENEFGDEAINTIVQEMENNRDETVVIFAGYPDKMERLFSRNPGLRSRVPFTVRFSDYSPDEMLEIAELEAKKRGFTIDGGAKETVRKICSDALRHKDAGNGRFCRSLVENAILCFALRTYGDGDSEAGTETVLEATDFSAPAYASPQERRPIGFIM